MKLLTKEIERKLRKNAALDSAARTDLKPVVKFFDPTGAGTWLFTELDENGDTLYGLCDPGLGSPELGYTSLSEVASFRGHVFGLGIERDMWFTPKFTLQEYAEKAAQAGRIVA